jgi:mannose/fructose/N-acetylgalactosamine-specific phosphotransferase system component IIC
MNTNNKIAWLIINLLGGTAVLSSYVYGFLTHPDAARLLWGGVPEWIRPLYTAWMLAAAAGYLLVAYYLLKSDFNAVTLFGRFDFRTLNFLYLLILIPSALWMPLTLAAAEYAWPGFVWLVRLDLGLVAVGSLGLLLAVIYLKPRMLTRSRFAAILGGAALSLQTVVLDAIIWSVYFR